MHKLPLVLIALALTGCVGNAVNQATIYRPVTGVIEMDVKVPTGESVDKVQFQVNDKVVGEDTDGTDGFSADVDTATLPVDTLAKLAAVGVRPNGSTVVLRENYILVERDDSTDASDSSDPLPLASSDAAGGDASAASVTPTATDATAAYKAVGPVPSVAPSKKPAAKKQKKTIIKLGG